MNRPISGTLSDTRVVVSFGLSSVGARKVFLALLFNDDRPARDLPNGSVVADRRGDGLSMVRSFVPLAQTRPGHWQCEVALAPGRHEYAFLVDGEWVIDPEAREFCRDGDGTHHCVRTVEWILPSNVRHPAPQLHSKHLRVADLRRAV